MDNRETRLILMAITDAANSAADTEGNGEDASHLASRGRFDECLIWLEGLQLNASKAAHHAALAIERIKKMKEKQ